MKIIERVCNLETGITQDIERDLTPDELVAHQASLARSEGITENLRIKTEARQAVMERLGITEAEAKALFN